MREGGKACLQIGYSSILLLAMQRVTDHLCDIELGDAIRIVVSLVAEGGLVWVDLRRHVESNRFTGFTKSGTRLPVKSFRRLVEAVNLIQFKDLGHDYEIVRVPKSADIDVVVQVTTFQGVARLDVREQIVTTDYRQFTKKGISIPLTSVELFKDQLNQALWAIQNYF